MIAPVRSLALKLYIFSFFDAFILIYPIYTLFFVHKGIAPYQISTLLIAWSATTFLLELPSGALADKLSRKKIMLIGIISKIIGYFVWLLFPTFWGFLLGFILWGVKSAFVLGAQEALIYEELKQLRQEGQYAKIMGWMKALNSLGMILSGVGARLLVTHGYTPVLIASIGSMIVSATALLLVAETPKSVGQEETVSNFVATIKGGLRLVFRQPGILHMVLFISAIYSLGVIDEFFSLLFHGKGLSNTATAYWVGAAYLSAGLGNILAHRFDGRKIPTVPSMLIWFGMFWLAALLPSPFAPLLICLDMFYFSGVVVLIHAYLQREFNDSSRATALSTLGVFIEAFSLITYIAIGIVTRNGNYGAAFQLVGGIAGAYGILLLIAFRKFWVTSTNPLGQKAL